MNKNNLILEDYDEKRCEIHLLNSIYLLWLESDDFENFEQSPIHILLLFKSYMLNNHKNVYVLCIDYIDNRIRSYYLFRKYTKKWLIKYINNKEPVNTEDLELNTIYDNKYYINYIDFTERKRYLFSENDFKKMVTSSLQNSYEYDIDPDPIPIRNPYTNKKFTKTELRMFNNSVRDMPIVWSMFVDSDFDIIKFKYKYYSRLLDICIPNYVDKLGDLDIIDYLIDIFIYSNTDYCTKCIIDKRDIRSRSVNNALISWIKYLKLNVSISTKSIDNLQKIYNKTSCFHIIKNNKNNVRDISYNMLDLDFTKPLFCVGYKTKEDKKMYWKRKIEQMRRMRYRSNMSNSYNKK